MGDEAKERLREKVHVTLRIGREMAHQSRGDNKRLRSGQKKRKKEKNDITQE